MKLKIIMGVLLGVGIIWLVFVLSFHRIVIPFLEKKIQESITGNVKVSAIDIDWKKREIRANDVVCSLDEDILLDLEIASVSCAFSFVELFTTNTLRLIEINNLNLHLKSSVTDLLSQSMSQKMKQKNSEQSDTSSSKSKKSKPFTLNQLIVNNATLQLNDQDKQTISIDNLNANVENITFPFSSNIKDMVVMIDAQVNKGKDGTIKLDGQLQNLKKLEFYFDADIESFSLPLLHVFLPKEKFSVERGTVSFKGSAKAKKKTIDSQLHVTLDNLFIDSSAIPKELFLTNPLITVDVSSSGSVYGPKLIVKMNQLKYKYLESFVGLHTISSYIDFSEYKKKNTILVKSIEIPEYRVYLTKDRNGMIPLLTHFKKSQIRQEVKETTSIGSTKGDEKKNTQQKMPELVFDTINCKNGTIQLTDYSIGVKPTIIELDNMSIAINNLKLPLPQSSTSDVVKFDVSTSINHEKAGGVRVFGNLSPYFQELSFKSEVFANDIDIVYFEDYYKPSVKMNINRGNVTLKSKLNCVRDQLTSFHEVDVNNLLVSSQNQEGTIYNIPEKVIDDFLAKHNGSFQFSFPLQGNIKDAKSMAQNFINVLVKEFVKKLMNDAGTVKMMTQKAIDFGKGVMDNPKKAFEKIFSPTSQIPGDSSRAQESDAPQSDTQKLQNTIQDFIDIFTEGDGK